MICNSHKAWLTPFMAVSYFAVSITGLLMLFHLKFPGVYPIHKWGGLVFVLIGIFHLILNWRLFIVYFKKRKAMFASMAAIVLLIIIATTTPSKESHDQFHDDLSRNHQYGGGLHRR